MLSPQELYHLYTSQPCDGDGAGAIGNGTPYDIPRLASFLKQLKYPCYNLAPYVSGGPSPSGIVDTGKNHLAIPFKFLQRLDVEAFTEIQPTIKSGTSHAVRNACDIMRACSLTASGNISNWHHRTAAEYIEYFGENYITNCLMMLGPDLVTEEEAKNRGTGCGPLSCLPRAVPRLEGSALGSDQFKCRPIPGAKGTECNPCDICPPDGNPTAAQKDCCSAKTCEEKMKYCCGETSGQRYGFANPIWEYREITSDEIIPGDDTWPLKHLGILKRQSYGGYINLLNNSGPNLYSCPGDILLRYFQSINNYNYKDHKYEVPKNVNPLDTIDRARTISMVQGSTSYIVDSIKDLIYNGYGVVLMTNVGFPNTRDSTGLSFPDRIWYHTYAIIGYDDRKVDYDECVFLLANSWGNWNRGGHPKWGPIPDGSFLVTESHLKCMTFFFRKDKIGCATRTYFSTNPQEIEEKIPCTEDSRCTPWECTKRQQAMGMVFAMSMVEGFPKQILDYAEFYKVREATY